jgi:hypothetical protein
MSTKHIEDTHFLHIKAAVLDPDSTELSPEQKIILDRYVSAAKVLDRYPVMRNAVKLHRLKYPNISQSLAYRDLHCASRLFNSLHTFDYDFWQTWLINTTVRMIQLSETAQDFKSMGAGLTILKKAIGEKPEKETDPKLLEKHNFFIQINNNSQKISVDLDKLNLIPKEGRERLADDLFSEISDEQAQSILES